MTAEHHARMMEVFNAVRAWPAEERSTFLDEACGADARLRSEVEELLEYDRKELSDAFSDAPTSGGTAPAIELSDPVSHPERIGPYRILGVLGEGGMGMVYRAEQASPEREVALKVIKRGALSSGLLQRFEYETRVLARLRHPGIAQIHEAGTADCDGLAQPYFAMELIDGSPITEHARAHDLGVRERLELVAEICDAVEHAHRRGVVHRDLKPANILVDEASRPKILDFGVARAIDADVRATLQTEAGQIVGTLSYMSPEQACGEPQEVDVRVDVYALGVVGYELLTGRLPHDLNGRHLTDALRLIVEQEPPALSTIDRTLRGDVETIIGKALAKEKRLRYGSAAELAADLRRYLTDRPILARPPSRLYLIGKFARRHTGLVVGLALAAVTLVVGTLVSVRLAMVAHDEAARATQTAESLQRLADDRLLARLTAEAEALWPADPDHLAALRKWRSDAQVLIDRLPMHEADLASLRARATGYSSEDQARDHPEHFAQLAHAEKQLQGTDEALKTASGEMLRERLEERRDQIADDVEVLQTRTLARRSWSFDLDIDAWHHGVLDGLVLRLRLFAGDPDGAVASVEKRVAFASSVHERTITSRAAAWRAANAALLEDARFAPLELTPQLGLIPLGRDPGSGLQEFLHLQTHSGEMPHRAEDGTLAMTEDAGVVFVLLPGGRFTMGYDTPSGQEDPGVRPRDDELPAHTVTLDPFFISKFEMTKGQWDQITGEIPGDYLPGMRMLGGSDLIVTRRYPVQEVSWIECDRVMRQLGLTLPTEAQWEYAARGGTKGTWWTGPKRASLIGAVNLADQAAARAGLPWPGIRDWPELDDGYVVHCSVELFRSNPFGLHNVYGNVQEWCRDGYAPYDQTPQAGDGLRVSEMERDTRASRGGGFSSPFGLARSSARGFRAPQYRSHGLGLRPARPMTR